MTYKERRDFEFDTELLELPNAKQALKIHHQFVQRMSARPTPRFFEIDRSPGQIDPLWHSSLHPRPQFTQRSPLEIPAINKFTKQSWVNTKYGRYAGRDDVFWISRVSLQEHNYFPEAGDLIYWAGYRYQIVNVNIPPNAYWSQTGVWMGLVAECVIAPTGDARPLVDLTVAAPSEISANPSPAKEDPEAARPLQQKKPLNKGTHAFPE